MKKILIVATAGAGGDLQPLVAVALGLRQRGHALTFYGDASVMKAAGGLGWRPGNDLFESPPEHDLGPTLIAAWSADLAPAVKDLVR